jgi:hypothetical protein
LKGAAAPVQYVRFWSGQYPLCPKAFLPRLYLPPLEPLDPPRLLPLDPLVDVALDPVVDVPEEPTTGALGATGALLGAVLPVEVLGGLPPPNGAGLGVAAGPGG